MTFVPAILALATLYVRPTGEPVYIRHFRLHEGGAVAYAQELDHQLNDAAAEHGIDPAILTALVWYESGFNPARVSRTGATGIGQLNPRSIFGRAARMRCSEAPLLCRTWWSIFYSAAAIAAYRDWCGSDVEAVGAYRSGRCVDAHGARRVMRLAAWIRAMGGEA